MGTREIRVEGGLKFTELLRGEKFCREEWRVEGSRNDWLVFRKKMHLRRVDALPPYDCRDKVLYHLVLGDRVCAYRICAYGVDTLHRINLFTLAEMREGIMKDNWLEIVKGKVQEAILHGNLVDALYQEIDFNLDDVYDYSEKDGGLVIYLVGAEYMLDAEGYLFKLA